MSWGGSVKDNSIRFLVDITTMITAHHKGYFELRLCQNDIPQIGNDSSVAVTQECFDQHLLQVETGGTT